MERVDRVLLSTLELGNRKFIKSFMTENMKELNAKDSPFLWSSKNMRTVAPHSREMRMIDGRRSKMIIMHNDDKKKRNADMPFMKTSVIRPVRVSKSSQNSPFEKQAFPAFRSTPLMDFGTLIRTDFSGPSTGTRTERSYNSILEELTGRKVEPVKPLRIAEERRVEVLNTSPSRRRSSSSVNSVSSDETKPSYLATTPSNSNRNSSGRLEIEIEKEIALPMPVLDSQKSHLMEFCKSISTRQHI